MRGSYLLRRYVFVAERGCRGSGEVVVVLMLKHLRTRTQPQTPHLRQRRFLVMGVFGLRKRGSRYPIIQQNIGFCNACASASTNVIPTQIQELTLGGLPWGWWRVFENNRALCTRFSHFSRVRLFRSRFQCKC